MGTTPANEKTVVSECCGARVAWRSIRNNDGKEIPWSYCTHCQFQCPTKICPDCDGYGEVTINAGYCGGCEVCGSTEAKEVPCETCQPYG